MNRFEIFTSVPSCLWEEPYCCFFLPSQDVFLAEFRLGITEVFSLDFHIIINRNTSQGVEAFIMIWMILSNPVIIITTKSVVHIEATYKNTLLVYISQNVNSSIFAAVGKNN